jgi:hypothetical protein
MGKLLLGGLLLAIVAGVAVQRPELKRYLKMARM